MSSLNNKTTTKSLVTYLGKGKLKLAQIADNSSYRKSLQQKKGEEKKGEGTRGRYKIRILGEHSGSLPSGGTEWAYPPQYSGSNPMASTGTPFFPKGTWVYVYLDEQTDEYFIDRVSPNTVCKQDPKSSGFEPGDTNLLIPDFMYDGTEIPNCATVFNSQVNSELDIKQDNVAKLDIIALKWCDAKEGEVGPNMNLAIEKNIKMSEQLTKAVKPFADFKSAIDNANKNLIGKDDKRGFFDALRQNDVTIQSVNNTVKIYQKNLKDSAEEITAWIADLLIKVKEKLIRKLSVTGNLVKGLAPNSGRFVTNDIWDKMIKALACIINKAIKALPDLIFKALLGFVGKIVNTGKCLIEKFIGGFLGQLVGQIGALITGVLKGVSSALSKISDTIGAGLNLIDSIGDVLDSLLSIFECEVKYCVGKDKVIRWNILNGGKPAENQKLDFAAIFKNAKTVGQKFQDLTKVPEDIANFQFNFDVDEALQDVFEECNTGPIVCGVPSVVFWGGGGSGGVGNPVISAVGDLLGVDIILPGNYTSAPLIDVEDSCGNGNGGTGRVFVGPITGIGTVGVATTGGITGVGTDLTDPTYPGDGGQGTTAGIGITYHVTVNAVAVGNRFFINDVQQKTLTFERGNTYILNQEHVSNNGHPLRFSETKDGAWVSGGKEYTRGVTIDGIPGLGVSATDTAYSRMVVDNNTPERLYYYCENHKKMGGVINVITPEKETIISSGGKNATVEIAAVNTSGGVIAVKNLKGGNGYNECMSNVPTHGGAGTGFTIKIVKTNEGSIEAVSLNNKGSNYQIGDIVTIIGRSSSEIKTPTTTGITKVLITNSGYGYLPAPNGSLGGMRRTWANRCQTIVRRKNFDWDAPYSEGDIINLYSGDWVQLPSQPKVYIDGDFDASKLPGAQVTGVSSYIPRDMTGFPLTDKTSTTSTTSLENVNFSTSTLIPTFAPDGLYDWQGNGPTGIARSDSSNPDVNAVIADWNFYLNGEYLGLFQQNNYSEIPQIRIGDIAYRVGTPRSYTPSDPVDSQKPWVRTADILRPTAWVLTASQGWSSFLKNYGVYPSIDDPQYKVIGTSSAIWKVATFIPGQYTVEMQADNVGTIYWDGVKLGSTLPYAGHNRELKFNFFAGDVEPAIHEIKVEIENLIHREVSKQESTRYFNTNPAAVAWVVKDPYGAIIKTSLDQYGVDVNYSDILYGYESYFSIKGYNVQQDKDEIIGEWFSCQDDYKRAKLLGFTDCDIRAYLEANPDILLDECMQAKLDDDNWGRCDGDLMVSITAPGCPKDPCLPNNTYPVIVCLDEIVVENSGFLFDCCKDTVKIEPANRAKAKIVECVDGQIRRIEVTDCGAGFTELPEISINTETGFNAVLKPIMKFHSPEEMDVPADTSVIQVVDCVGKVT